MLETIDHIGYLARDLEGGLAELMALTGLESVRRFERSQFSLRGAYLGPGNGHIEIFSLTDQELLDKRLGSAELRLDHIAYEVEDIAAEQARMGRAGVRFCGADQREVTTTPFDLGGVLHLWTVPETAQGQSIQLLQRPAAQR